MEFHVRKMWIVARSRSEIHISDIFELSILTYPEPVSSHVTPSQLVSVRSMILILFYNLLDVVSGFPTTVTLHLFSPILPTFIAHFSHPDCTIWTRLDGLSYKLWTSSCNILLQSGPNIFQALSVHALPSKQGVQFISCIN